MIRRADLDRPVCERALRMFERLGEVEAAAHGIPLEQVHFHEVGAVDSILDVVAAALCIERLQIAATYATPVCVGSGSVRTAHGQLPVPAPATEKLLHGMPTIVGDLSGEWTTPTGALILDELQPKFSIPMLVTTASTLGGGTRNPARRPNVLRLRLAETTASSNGALQRDELCAIYANIDDASGEMLGSDLIDLLLRAGARDALIHPVIMKKGRPAHQLEVLAEPDEVEKLAEVILTHTSTIGVRIVPVHRRILPRETLTVATAFGDIAAKRVTLPSGAFRVMPEYESCREAAARAGVPVQDVYRSALGGSGQ
jgi:pyridinium-3,5-bisthiocarboxylic acid mononucleotide nickel chelatase